MRISNSVARIAEAVADAAEIDWDEAERTATDDRERAVLRRLRRIGDTAAARRLLSSQSLRPGNDPAAAAPISLQGLRSGEHWGHLRVKERIGGGGFADVYRAWDTRLDREVALKLLRRSEAADGDGSTTIEEGRKLARVKHPNVAIVYGAERFEGRVGLWMEFVQGRTLHEIVGTGGPMSTGEAALIGMDLCRALAAVHAAGLLHRDVKPQNVMRERGGRTVLMDLGTAHDIARGTSAPAGTPMFMAPELFEGSHESARSDIYSAGAVLFFLTTGQYPVNAVTLAAMREAHRHDRRRHLVDLRPDLPGPFVEVVERAMDADPQRRFGTAGEMERALRPEAGRAGNRWRRAPLTTAVAIGLILGLAALGIKAWRSIRPQSLPIANLESASVRRFPLPPNSFFSSISADGRFILYHDQRRNLHVIETATGRSRPVVEIVNGEEPARRQSPGDGTLSADGSHVAYAWSFPDGRRELRALNIDERWPNPGMRHEPKTLVTARQPESLTPLEWSRDGMRILAAQYRADGSMELFLVHVDGSRRTLQTFEAFRPRRISLSPDGHFVVYDLPAALPSPQRDLYILATDGSRPATVLLGGEANDELPIWSAEGTSVFFVSDTGGAMAAWRMPVRNGMRAGSPREVARGVTSIVPIAVTTNGDLHYHLQTGREDVFLASLNEHFALTAPPQVLAAATDLSRRAPAWSPDGRTLAHVVWRGRNLFDTGSSIRLIDWTSGSSREILPRLRYFGVAPIHWSPDGRSLLVRGRGFDGQAGFYRIDVKSGETTPIIRGQDGTFSVNAAWTADGREMLYSRGTSLIAHNAADHSERLLITMESEFINAVAAAPNDGRVAVSVASPDRTSRLLVLDPGGTVRELHRVREGGVFLKEWTADGAALLFATLIPQRTARLAFVPAGGGPPMDLGIDIEWKTITSPAGAPASIRADRRLVAYSSGGSFWEQWVMTGVAR